MTVRLAINPMTWTNDDLPELGGDTPLETCLSEASEAGYEGIELGHKFPRSPAALRPLLGGHGLSLASGWYGSRLVERSAAQEIDAVADHLALLADMGCTAMVFAEVTGSIHGDRRAALSTRPVLPDGAWPGFGERLSEVAEQLLARGVRLAFHHHMGTVVQSAADVDRLMAATSGAVGLLVDTGHLTFAGADPVAVLRAHAGRVHHVHCKDVRPDALARALAGDWSFLDAVLDGVFTVPGDGAVDFATLLRVLREHDYSGWLVVEAEQDPAKAHPLTYACLGHATLKALVAETGL